MKAKPAMEEEDEEREQQNKFLLVLAEFVWMMTAESVLAIKLL
jgi:hypothetical protein